MNNCYFFVPALKLGSLSKYIDKDKIKMVVIDLEDSIHPKLKEKAREEVAGFDFSHLLQSGVKLGIRINSINTFDGLRDILFLKQMDGKHGFVFEDIFVPKICSSRDLEIYKNLFAEFSVIPNFTAIIETIQAVNNVSQIASSCDALCLGQADLVSAMYHYNDTYVNHARAMICVAAAQYDILAIATNSFEIDDINKLKQDCLDLKNAGFTGMAAIHPRQIDTLNQIFSVDENEIHRLNGFIDDYINSDVGFIISEEKIIAPPFVAKAKSMIRLYESMVG